MKTYQMHYTIHLAIVEIEFFLISRYCKITANQHLHVWIFNGKNHENTLFFPLEQSSMKMDECNFLDLKSSKIGKLCLKLGNIGKLTNYTLPLMVYICLWGLFKNQILIFFNEK